MARCIAGLVKGKLALFALAVSLVALAGCQGPTSVTAPEEQGQFKVVQTMDPVTLNPPQRGTLTYEVFSKETGKPVTTFEPVNEALLHTISIRRDLLFMRHSVTDRLVLNKASVPSYFPTTGEYHLYTLFQPTGAPLQVFTSTITTGDEGPEPQLREDANVAKVAAGVRVQLVKGPEPFKAEEPSQFAFHMTERGNPVTSLWPLFGAAGHVWMVDAEGHHFTHLVGAAESRSFAQEPADMAGTPESRADVAGTPPAPTTQAGPGARGTRTTTVAGVTTAVPGPIMGSSGGLGGTEAFPTVPTLEPGLAGALAATASVPPATLAPVQKTAQLSVVETPAVLPAVGFGPDVVFTHTFREPGLYKLWFEFFYRDQTITVEYVVRVVE